MGADHTKWGHTGPRIDSAPCVSTAAFSGSRLANFERSAALSGVEPAKTYVKTAAVVEVWEAFSTESSARKLAHAASEELDVEIDVVERSPNRFVPTVMCRQGKDCSSILSSINAIFSFGQTDA